MLTLRVWIIRRNGHILSNPSQHYSFISSDKSPDQSHALLNRILLSSRSPPAASLVTLSRSHPLARNCRAKDLSLLFLSENSFRRSCHGYIFPSRARCIYVYIYICIEDTVRRSSSLSASRSPRGRAEGSLARNLLLPTPVPLSCRCLCRKPALGVSRCE